MCIFFYITIENYANKIKASQLESVNDVLFLFHWGRVSFFLPYLHCSVEKQLSEILYVWKKLKKSKMQLKHAKLAVKSTVAKNTLCYSKTAQTVTKI